MVKDSKKKSGSKATDDDVRSERLTMRVHGDLMHILDKRAKEKNLSRSAYIESILIGFCQADPRNPKHDARGKRVDGAQKPIDYLVQNPLGYANKWAAFNNAYRVLFGTSTPDQWEREPRDFWLGDDN